VRWAEEHSAQWHHLVRETIVTAARMEALKRAAARLLDQCVDITAINLPLANLVGADRMRFAGPGFSGIVDVRSEDLTEAGLKAGIVTQREIDKAENV
jgi:hypothetical protein